MIETVPYSFEIYAMRHMSQSRLTAARLKTEEERPRASRGPARLAEILTAAEDVFLEQGYGAATMDDIAARAGASKATMYKHFGSKEALFAEIVSRSVPDITRGSTRALQAEGTLHAVLVNWSLELLKHITPPRSVAMYKLIIAESSRSPELAKIYYEKGPASGQRQLTEFFRQAAADGRMRCPDPKLASRLFMAATFGDGFERAVFVVDPDSERTTKVYVNEAVAMFLARYGG